MNSISAENRRLLFVMLVAAIGSFCYFPYVTTTLVAFLGMDSADMATLVGSSMVVGNVLAYGASLRISPNTARRVLMIGYGVLVIAIGVMASARYFEQGGIMVVAGTSLIIYRFAIALTSNLARIEQLQSLPDRSAKPALFSYIKLVTCIGAAVGPAIGSLVLKLAGMPGVMLLSCALFLFAAIILFTIRSSAQPKPESNRHPSRDFKMLFSAQQRAVIFFGVAGMFHYVFEAQIYAAIAMAIRRNSAEYEQLIALLVSSNALLAMVLVVPLLRLLNAHPARYRVLATGTLLSCLAVMLAPTAHNVATVAGISILFTLGGIVSPQILVDMATDGETDEGGHAANGAVATYNFLTMGLGLGLGYWIGGWVTDAASSAVGIAVWGAVYGAYVITLFICKTHQHNSQSVAISCSVNQ